MSCRRRYYYSYYAALEDPEIHRLKKLSALPLWAGSVVHDAIERFLRAHDALPPPEEQEAFIRAVVHSGMLTDWRESEAGGRCASGSSSTSTACRSSRRTSGSPSTS